MDDNLSALTAPASFDAIRKLLADLPKFDQTSAECAQEHDRNLTKPPGALGRLEEVVEWLAGWQHQHPPRLERCAIVIFAANHGITDHPVSAFPSDVTAQMVANFAQGGAAINQLAKSVGARLSIVDAGVDQPTKDFSQQPAMTEAEFCKAFKLGWHAVSDQDDLLAVGEMGIGNTTAAAAICHGLFGGTAQDWTGPGTGVTGQMLTAKINLVDQAVRLHQDLKNDPLELFAALGGKELAAIAGAVLSARVNDVPVLLDGYITTASIAPLCAITTDFSNHCWPGHRSAEPAHATILSKLKLQPPLLDLSMRLGEGSGAALSLAILQAAVSCHNNMASFASAGVSNKTKGAL